jgi:hypothetical protein
MKQGTHRNRKPRAQSIPKCQHTCSFREDHDPETLEPRGPGCGKRATHELYWADGRVSPSCPKHGLPALDKDARALVVRVTKPRTEKEWATEG